MAKSVTLGSGRAFRTLSAAKSHFQELLERQEVKRPFAGTDLAEVLSVYEGYCAKTNWPVPSPPSSFYPTHGRGPGYTTLCYGVTFEDGTSGIFSMEKALAAVAV